MLVTLAAAWSMLAVPSPALAAGAGATATTARRPAATAPARTPTTVRTQTSSRTVRVGSLSVTFPAVPTTEVVPIATKAGTFSTRLHQSADGLLTVSETPFALLGDAGIDPTVLMTNALNGTASSIKGTVRSKVAGAWGKRPALDVVIEFTGGTFFARYVADTRSTTIIQFIGITPTPKAAQPSASFQTLLGTVTGI